MIETVKAFLAKFKQKFSAAEEINNDDDYDKVKKWVKKTTKTYKKATIIAVIISILIIILFASSGMADGFLLLLIGIIFTAVEIVAAWGIATMKMHKKEVRKSAWQFAKYGYLVGEQIQETHVDVSHEFGNTYKVTTRTENKGLLFAVISVSIILITWGAYCIYLGSFLTMKKIKLSKENLAEYKNF